FAATLEVVEEAGYDAAYTFVFSPRPGTEAAAWVDEFVAADVTADRMRRLTEVVERSALARHEARVGRREEVLVEGPSKKDPAMTTGRTREQARPLPGAGGRRCAGGGLRRGGRRLGRAALPARDLPPQDGRCGPAGADSRLRLVTAGTTTAVTHLALVGPTAAGKSALALAAAEALGDVEIVSVDSMQV